MTTTIPPDTQVATDDERHTGESESRSLLLSIVLYPIQKLYSLITWIRELSCILWHYICRLFSYGIMASIIVWLVHAEYGLETTPSTALYGRNPTGHQPMDLSTFTLAQKGIANILVGERQIGPEMALRITRLEMDTNDLIVFTFHSGLTARPLIQDVLTRFSSDAVKAAASLQDLDAKMLRTMDWVIAVNNGILQSIKADLSSFPQSGQTRHFNMIFNDTMTSQLTLLGSLAKQTASLVHRLQRMKERLQLIHNLTTKENATLCAEMELLHAPIWTAIGRNRDESRRLSANMIALEKLEKYTNGAKDYTAQALLDMQKVHSHINDLRKGVLQSTTGVIGIPLEFYTRTIEEETEKMKKARNRVRFQMTGIPNTE